MHRKNNGKSRLIYDLNMMKYNSSRGLFSKIDVSFPLSAGS